MDDYSHGQLELIRIEKKDQVNDYIAAVRKISINSWQELEIGRHPDEFLIGLDSTLILSEKNLLRAYLLKSGKEYCAFAHGYQFRNTVYHYSDIGFDKKFAKYSPGAVLLFLMIKDLIGHNKPDRLIFGIGHAGYKSQFGNDSSIDADFLLLGSNMSNKLKILVHQSYLYLKKFSKRYLIKPSDM